MKNRPSIFSWIPILLLAGGGCLHACTQIANHLNYLADFWQEILIPISLAMIFAPVLYVVRYSLNQPLILILVALGLGSKLIHLFLDFADDAPALMVYPIFNIQHPLQIFLKEVSGASAIALLLAAMYYFIVSYQRSEGSLSKERDSMKREVNNHPQRGWLEG